jgi:hypothetical protein
MRLISLLMLLVGAQCGSLPLCATNPGAPDINETSPNGKWLFEAHWFGYRGYLWDLKNIRTGKSYFSIPHLMDIDALPHQMNVLWSSDNRYAAINVYYGRIVYGINVISLKENVPHEAAWPSSVASMIKPEDQKIWTGEGDANTSASRWEPNDILDIDLDMRANLEDKNAHQKIEIDSSRSQSIQFVGLKGKIVKDDPPVYDKVPSQ